MYERIHNGPITDAVIAEWGYDESLLLSDQDEDLLLGFERYFPALSQLARDPLCPKADYALSIMDFSMMFKVLRKAEGADRAVHWSMSLFQETALLPQVQNFLRVNQLRIALLSGERNISHERAIEIGTAALNGISRQADITLSDKGECWLIELSVPPFHRHKEWLSINKKSGDYAFRR